MEPKIEFVPSAFRHGFTEEDIRWVLNNYLVDGVVEEDDETIRIVVGFDRAVNILLEIMCHKIEDETAGVINAQT